ncbi:MAG TPA: hypothetical protein VFM59_02910, partial [Salinimicrobium sp.]|nr:hypothetical protein [Salinimicrobium sp.]
PRDDAEGITVYNKTTNRGTISTEEGDFMLAVALGDTIAFSAVQFQDFSVVIDQGVIDSGQLNVVINEAVNQLAEVVVRPYDLSGNVAVDVNRIAVAPTNLPAMSAAEINEAERQFLPDRLTVPENSVMGNRFMEHGLNFANIFRAIFASRDQSEFDTIAVEEQILLLYDDEFFRENLDVEKENINDFISFAEENGLSEEMLKEGNQLDLIEFLIAQSKSYNLQVSAE